MLTDGHNQAEKGSGYDLCSSIGSVQEGRTGTELLKGHCVLEHSAR
jgi:hypothetical protein